MFTQPGISAQHVWATNMFVQPVNRDNFVTKPPWIVIAVIVTNSALFLITYANSPHQLFLSRYGFVPAHPRAEALFSSMFLHAGIGHLVGNMWFLWMFGVRVENSLGRLTFLMLYVISGLGAQALHYVFNASSTLPCVGASGAISGVAAAYFVLFPRSLFDLEIYFFRFHLKTITTRTHVAVGAWIGEQLLLGLLTKVVRFTTVAFWAHVGGFSVGLAGTLLFLAPRPRQYGIEALSLSVPTEVYVAVHNLDAMRKWYCEKLGFREVEMAPEDEAYGGAAALKPGGDGEPIFFRFAGKNDTPTTIAIYAKDLQNTRVILSSLGLRASPVEHDQHGRLQFSVPDLEGNIVKVMEES
jgi:membrane associated rhomboid family serine protease/catechol 2,3-dioxygenase-like lactoylglutathione lyase family enzyme